MALFCNADLRRRGQERDPKKKFWLFCEGKNTEPMYFDALGVMCRETLIEVNVAGAVGDPSKIAEVAGKKSSQLGCSAKGGKKLESYEMRDEVWAVFDRDIHARFEEAIKSCNDLGVHVARSNPCFEVWLILHFVDYHKPDHRHSVQKTLQKHCPEYDPKRGKNVNCAVLIKNIAQAEARAELQLAQRSEERIPFGAPSTTVFQLTRKIRKEAKIIL
jgi:hypothetical protein